MKGMTASRSPGKRDYSPSSISRQVRPSVILCNKRNSNRGQQQLNMSGCMNACHKHAHGLIRDLICNRPCTKRCTGDRSALNFAENSCGEQLASAVGRGLARSTHEESASAGRYRTRYRTACTEFSQQGLVNPTTIFKTANTKDINHRD